MPLTKEVAACSSADRELTFSSGLCANRGDWMCTPFPTEETGLLIKVPLRVLSPHLSFSLLFFPQSSGKSLEPSR